MTETDLVNTALGALVAADANGYEVPDSDEECATEMIEHGVFGPTEDCLTVEGKPLPMYVEAVSESRRAAK